MDGLSWKTLLKWMIWGYHYFQKHPYGCFLQRIHPQDLDPPLEELETHFELCSNSLDVLAAWDERPDQGLEDQLRSLLIQAIQAQRQAFEIMEV